MQIKGKNITKNYGTVRALSDIRFQIKEGEFLTLAGANGAGKSTLIDILLKRIKPDTGVITINDVDLNKLTTGYFRNVSAVFQNHRLDQDLTCYENIYLRALLHYERKQARSETLQWLKRLQLEDSIKKRYRQLSGGEQRKLDLIAALISKPEFLFLDEPTTGIDVQSRRQIWSIIHQARQQTKMSILLTTHYLEEAEQSDYMIILRKGKVVAEGTPYHLKQSFTKHQCILHPKNAETLYARLQDMNYSCFLQGNTIICTFDTSLASLDLLNQIRPELNDYELQLGSLERVFLTINQEDEHENA